MKLLYIIYLTLIVLTSSTEVDEAQVNYYLNLINEEIARATSTQLPPDASGIQPYNVKPENFGIYDYIVVGAGSAGAVIASRLSENPKNKILLLEAGGHESEFSDIPGVDTFLRSLEFTWNFTTVPQTTACLAMRGTMCFYPRGRGLGGSSIIYALMHTRGNKVDYDRWYEQGNPGWSFKDVLPLLKKIENFLFGDKGYHGIGGNINVETTKPDTCQLKAFLDGNMELGRKLVDYNGDEQLGVSRVQFNTINGRRDSTGKTYLRLAEKIYTFHPTVLLQRY